MSTNQKNSDTHINIKIIVHKNISNNNNIFVGGYRGAHVNNTTKSDFNININIDIHINNKINITIINDNPSFNVGGVLRTLTTKTWNIKKIPSTLKEVTPISSSSINRVHENQDTFLRWRRWCWSHWRPKAWHVGQANVGLRLRLQHYLCSVYT